MKLFKALLIFWLSATAAAASARKSRRLFGHYGRPVEGADRRKRHPVQKASDARLRHAAADFRRGSRSESLLSASGTGYPDRKNLSDGRQEQRGRRDQRRILQNENYPGRSRRPDQDQREISPPKPYGRQHGRLGHRLAGPASFRLRTVDRPGMVRPLSRAFWSPAPC